MVFGEVCGVRCGCAPGALRGILGYTRNRIADVCGESIVRMSDVAPPPGLYRAES